MREHKYISLAKEYPTTGNNNNTYPIVFSFEPVLRLLVLMFGVSKKHTDIKINRI